MVKKNVAYTITTGYYPEIASEISGPFKGKGTGRIMQRSYKARGFSPASIQRQEMLSKKNELLAQIGMKGKFSAGMARAAVLGMKGKYGVTMFAQGKQHRDSFKFIGGDERYKLFGDMVWYMHGKRSRKEMISEALSNRQMTGPEFQTIYHDAQPEMVKYAKKLAEKVFDNSWDVAVIEKHLLEQGEDVAEEIGFTIGEWPKEGSMRYMSMEKAKKEDYIQKGSDISAARDRDIVKVNHEGKVMATYDVTEQAITTTGQHGITEQLPEELIELIKEIDPKNKGKMEKLRKGVSRMFIKQIDRDYNPMIKYFKKQLISPQGQNTVKWDTILKKAAPDKKGKVTMKDLAKNMPSTGDLPSRILELTPSMTVEKAGPMAVKYYHFMHTEDKTRQQTSLEYIAHMLGSLTSDVNENFKQAHRVAEYGEENVYAVVPMKTHIGGEENLLFDRDAPNDTALVTGINATLALEKEAFDKLGIDAAMIARTQNNAYMIAKTTHGVPPLAGGATGIRNNQRSKGLRPATNISIPAGPKLHEYLVGLLEGVVPDLGKIEGMKKKLKGNTLGLKRDNKTFDFNQAKNSMFWALPYIGVLQSEYTGKKKK